MSAHCSSADSSVPSKGQRNVSPAPIPTYRPGDLIGTMSRITLYKPMPDQATPVKARAARPASPAGGLDQRPRAIRPALTRREPRMRLNGPGRRITPQAIKTFARTARTDGGGYRRVHLRALAQRPTGRSRSERTAHHGIEKRASAQAGRGFKRKNGRFWRAQFCPRARRPGCAPWPFAPRSCLQGQQRKDRR
jgi:hypothetical protein